MLVIVWAVALVLLALVWLAVRTPWGRVLRAIREDEDAAASLGKNVFAYKLQALALGSALAGVAGLLLRVAVLVLQPRRLPAAADVLRVDDRDPRRARPRLGGAGRRAGLRLPLRRHALPRLPAALVPRLGADRAYVRLIVIGLVIIGLVLLPAAGDPRQARGDGARVSARLEVRRRRARASAACARSTARRSTSSPARSPA